VDKGCSQGRSRTRKQLCFFMVFMVFLFFSFLFFSFHFLTSSRLCNGHAPLIIQEQRARAGQNVQPRRDRPNSDLNSSLAHGNREKISVLNCTSLSSRMFLHKDFSVIMAFAHGMTCTCTRNRYIPLFSLSLPLTS
jgi:hypothetical protein